MTIFKLFLPQHEITSLTVRKITMYTVTFTKLQSRGSVIICECHKTLLVSYMYTVTWIFDVMSSLTHLLDKLGCIKIISTETHWSYRVVPIKRPCRNKHPLPFFSNQLFLNVVKYQLISMLLCVCNLSPIDTGLVINENYSTNHGLK